MKICFVIFKIIVNFFIHLAGEPAVVQKIRMRRL
jgi:hypothetical protein